MFFLVLKTVITGVVVVTVSEIAKRSSLLAGILASLPLTSILALIWFYIDTHDTNSTSRLSISIFWMVLPSLFFFITFPLLIKWGFRFYLALIISSLLTAGIYWLYIQVLKQLGVTL
ncbi:MAG: DUF3147 family protein [Deltaproteobacteria bacterium]|nr:DUF3147 family protein [Deltaproteobacteria bacterium]